MLALACLFATGSHANAETRTLKLYYIHTGEKAEITFKKNGKYLPSGLKQLNHFLRDWRRNEPTKMDPRLFDVVWQVYKNTGASGYIHVVSAYRSPATNSMLRKRGRGVAEKSQHMLGRAMDFFIPGVKLKELRYAGLRLQGGGVGYYPTSGSPFVHLDVGNVRHWPKMSRTELAAVFPSGKTMHVPTDGKPLPGYDQAVAAYKQRKGTAVAYASADEVTKKRGFLASLFGGGADEAEETGGNDESVARAPVAVASAAPAQKEIPVPAAQPEAEPATIVAALPLRDVPTPLFAPRPSADVGPAEVAPAVAAAQELTVGEAEQAVAENVPVPLPRPAYSPETAIAAASTETPAVTAIAGRPAASAGELAIETVLANESRPAEVNGIPIPQARPGAPVVLASLASRTPQAATDAPAPESVTEIAALGERPASPRNALRGKTGDPVAALNAGPATTPKSPRPMSGDGKPDPKPVQVPIKAGIVDRTFSHTLFVRQPSRPDGKAFAVSSLRQAPTEVYTAGFQQVAQAPDPKRFTGKAVTFMSVAKFETN
ncbi:MAG: DUF882 domain-containing protein [Mesorhizobium sp.]|nr:DUF882 domain-containing protein [Mesorhizobium sp.]MCO5162538.1 DUF882 domain-containing protein [Mesorhizobium sp.]